MTDHAAPLLDRPHDESARSPAAVQAIAGRSLTATIYAHLRADILKNQLAPGEKLRLALLQERFAVSLSVVREALSRLVADGLVVAEAQRGFRVSAISKSDLIDVTRTRIGIESMAVERAIANGDAAWQASVEQSYDRLRRVSRDRQLEAWGNAHSEFHRLLVAPCDSQWLLRFRDVLFEQSERYRYAVVVSAHPPKTSEVDEQHRRLLDAVVRRDCAGAKAAIELHFLATLERVMTSERLS